MDALPPHVIDYFRPSLPTVQCVVEESARYQIPVPVTLSLMKTEGGRPGMVSRNKKTPLSDLGVMQVNELWLGPYSKRTGVKPEILRALLINNGCFSVSVGLDILAAYVKSEGSLAKGVAAYHSKTPSLGAAYLQRVEANLQGLYAGRLPQLADNTPAHPQFTTQ